MNTLLLAALAGFFSVEKTPEGRWWVKDAEGKRTIIRGVDWVIYRGHRCEADGARHHYREWNDAHYASPAVWEEETLARFKEHFAVSRNDSWIKVGGSKIDIYGVRYRKVK